MLHRLTAPSWCLWSRKTQQLQQLLTCVWRKKIMFCERFKDFLVDSFEAGTNLSLFYEEEPCLKPMKTSFWQNGSVCILHCAIHPIQSCFALILVLQECCHSFFFFVGSQFWGLFWAHLCKSYWKDNLAQVCSGRPPALPGMQWNINGGFSQL